MTVMTDNYFKIVKNMAMVYLHRMMVWHISAIYKMAYHTAKENKSVQTVHTLLEGSRMA